MSPQPYRLAYIAQHPVQYHAGLFRALARRSDCRLTVYYCARFGAESGYDADFKTTFSWDIPLTEGYGHVFLRNLSPLPFVASRAYFWRLVNPGVVWHIGRGRYDAVIVHGYHLSTYWAARGAARLFGTPFLVTGETVPSERDHRRGPRRWILGRWCRAASACIAIGSASREFYLNHGVPGERIFLAPYAVPNETFHRAAMSAGKDLRALRSSLGLDEDRHVILFCGKLIEKKRPLDVLEAAERIGIRSTVLYVGDGPLRSQVESRAATLENAKLVLAGFQNQSVLPRYYAAADVLVLPSGPGETFGLVLNEAMASGLPVVASDHVPAHRDLVVEGRTGYTFPARDIDQLADRLRRILGDAGRRQAMGKAALQHISGWNHDRAADGILSAVRFVRPTPIAPGPSPARTASMSSRYG